MVEATRDPAAGPGPMPHVMGYLGVEPRFAGAPVHAGPRSAVLGRATIGRDAWLGAGSVIRADGETVTIGDGFRFGARGTVHIATDAFPTWIGDGVTAGPDAVIHACRVGDGCWIGAGAVILDGSVLGHDLALAAGSVVYPRSELTGGWYWEGAPARATRRLQSGELEAMRAATRSEPDEAMPGAVNRGVGLMFVAATARITGRVTGAGGNGVWHGCDLDGGGCGIVIAAETNIQDNTRIVARDAPVVIGARVTVGHNVTMEHCAVGDGALIGIGARLAPGTRVGRGVLLAAGSRTAPGQVLDDGHLYAGRPARRLKPLDAAKRSMMAGIWPHYIDYARAFDAAQSVAAEDRARS